MKPLLILFAVSLTVRAVFLAVVELPMPRDAAGYLHLGDNLVKTGELAYDSETRSYRGPTYPLFVAACQFISGTDTPEDIARSVSWAQAFLSAFLPLAVYGLARRGFAQKTALLSGYLCAFYPDLVFYSGMVLTESLSLLLLFAGLLAFVIAWEGRGAHAGWAFASGVSLVAAFLSRGLSISGFAGLGVLVFVRRDVFSSRPKHAMLVLSLFVLGCAAVEAPWIVRNYQIHGHFVPNTIGHFWHSVHGGYSDVALFNEFESPSYLFSPELTEIEEEALLREEVLSWIREHPGLSALLVYTRSLRFWIPWRDIEVTGMAAPWSPILTLLVFSAAFGMLLMAAPFGFALRGKRAAIEWMLAGHVIALCGLCCLVHWETRYRIGIIPVLLIYAADLWVHRRAYATALRDGLAGFRRRAGLAAAFVVYHLAGAAAIFWFLER